MIKEYAENEQSIAEFTKSHFTDDPTSQIAMFAERAIELCLTEGLPFETLNKIFQNAVLQASKRPSAQMELMRELKFGLAEDVKPAVADAYISLVHYAQARSIDVAGVTDVRMRAFKRTPPTPPKPEQPQQITVEVPV